MSLDDVLAECLAIANSDKPPPNEATTCDWIIRPLLLAVGYANTDIISQLADSNKDFPDYTILPDTLHTWFLEAKAWGQELQDAHAQQSLNYANLNGSRWVVLSNGREWRLYDNRVQGVAQHKLVAEAGIASDEFKTLLQALGKESVSGGGLERYAVTTRGQKETAARRALVSEIIKSAASDPGCALVQSMLKHLKKDHRLNGLTAAEVSSALAGLIHKPNPAPPPTRPRPADGPPPNPEGLCHNFQDLAQEGDRLARNNKPAMLVFPDGSDRTVTSWRVLAIEIVSWLGHGRQLPIPFRGRSKGKCWFLNSEPSHESHPMRSYASIDSSHQTIFVDTCRSAADLLRCLDSLCHKVGVDPNGIRLTLRDA